MKNLWKQMSILFFMIVSVSICGNVNYAEAAAAQIAPAEIVNGSENISGFANYTYDVPAYTSSNESTTARTVVPVNVSGAGSLYIAVNSSQIVNDIKISLWMDENCTYAACDRSYFSASPNEALTRYINISNAGTYYMCIQYSSYNKSSVAGTVNITPYFVSRGDRTLAQETWTAVAPGGSNTYTYIEAVVASDGYIGITQNNSKAGKVNVGLCKGSKASKLADKSIAVNTTTWYPVTAGVYYINTNGISDAISTIKWQFATEFSATQNKPFIIDPLDTAAFDVKIKAEKTGLLTLAINGSESAYITFLDSKKKAISGALWNWGSTSSVAVEKGKTYYIRVNASIGDDARNMTYTIDESSMKKNTSKGKAVALKAKKNHTSVFLAGDTKWHYFKFKLTKSKKLNMAFKVEGNGKYNYELLKGNKKVNVLLNSSKGMMTTSGKLSTGTYYLRVKMANKTSSGRITLKLK